MTAWQRCAVAALTLILGWSAFSFGPGLLVARDARGRTTQLPGVEVEPPAVAAPPELEVCPIDPPPPVIALRVRVPACAAIGQELEYRIRVENLSRAAAHHVLVRNPLPTGVKLLRTKPEAKLADNELFWALGTLEAGACCDLCLVVCPTGPCDVKSCARVQFEHGQCVTTRLVQPKLTLKKCGPAQAMLNDTVKFELCVGNTGDAPAEAVTLTDDLPEGLEPVEGSNPLGWDIGALAPGEERRIEYCAVAKKAGRWMNRAVATCAAGQREEAACAIVIGEAKLALNKSGPVQRNVNRPATYHLTVSNPGVTTLTNVAIADLVPDKTTFVSASDDGQLTDGVVRWSVGTLAPGARKTVQMVLKASEIGEIVNRATASASGGVTAEAESRTLFEGGSGLTADIDDRDDPLEVGGQTVYTITVLNQGSAPAKQVVVTAIVPDQLEIKAVDGPSMSREEGQRVSFAPITVEPRTEAVYKITVLANKPGDVRFRVELTADLETLPSGLPVRREESTTIFDPQLPNTPPLADPVETPQSRRRQARSVP